MLRYVVAATALKAFSANSLSKKIYRNLGNTFGEQSRLAVDDIEVRIERGNLLVDLCKRYVAVKNGDRILEIGTGWMHWYSLYLRLFYDLQVTALDIWDNRQFKALQAAVEKLSVKFEQTGFGDSTVRDNLHRVLNCASFAELYRALNYDYVIEPTGAITGFPDQRFDFITSFHVLEHVPVQCVEQLTVDMFRTLKPGAFTIHQIGIDDHLTHYDKKTSAKEYLKYSDSTWRLFFENEVQYFNRLQPSDWLSAFDRAGFFLVEKIANGIDIDALKIHSRFRSYPQEDLQCTTLTLVYQKPSM